jgi:predicted nucleotidyltransferase
MDTYPRGSTAAVGTAIALSLIAVAIAATCIHSVQAGGAAQPFRITSHDPTAHEVGVAVNANVQATFNYALHLGTVTNYTFVVHGHLGGLAGGAFGYDAPSRTVTLDPSRAFHTGEVLRVSATSGILNAGSDALEPYGWQFTVSPVRDRRFAGFIDIDSGLTPCAEGSVAWGDYDNDGDLDILLTGNTGPGWPTPVVSKVYRNDGGGAFTDIGAGLTDVYHGSVAWGDYDNDGDLDILLTGTIPWPTTYVSKVYRNVGGGVFTESSAVLTGVYHSSVDWGDYDNDGDLDILLTGSIPGSPYEVSQVYRNDGGGVFADVGASLDSVHNSSAAWGDYDNDGDLDILLAGRDGGPIVSQVYRNDGGGSFTDIGAGLYGVEYGSAAWGDYDNDGDLDILLTGSDGLADCHSKVYRNDGASNFTEIGAGLAAVSRSSVAWGDYDNDGDLDILLTGATGAYPDWNPTSKVYRNDGGGAFTDIGAGLTGVYMSSAAWGDYDNDSDLDILVTGYDGTDTAVTMLYLNNSQPEVVRVDPEVGMGRVGVTTYFTTTWSDRDGSPYLKQCYFHIGASPALAGNVTLMYNATKNKLWMMDDSGSGWMGGHSPESVDNLDNSQARVYCLYTHARRLGNRLEVTWAIRFKEGFEGAKKLGLKAKDRYKARAKAKWKGTWTIKP